MKVTRLRPYKVVDLITSEFFDGDSEKNDQFCFEDLAKSGLDPDDMLISAPGNLKLPQFALAGYHIPYFDMDGRVLTRLGDNSNIFWRLRLKLPEFSKDAKYLQTDKERASGWGLPTIVPYLLPFPKEYSTEKIYCVEGEKKTASVIKHFGVSAFGIAGCQMWRNPDGTGGVHPWITGYVRQHSAKTICIIPDADILRYDMCQTYGTYAEALRREGFEVELLHLPSKIDDLIVGLQRQGRFTKDLLDTFERLAPEGLVQTPASLAKHYNLAFRSNDKGIVTVHQHTANIMKLLENNNAFPRIWRNLDTNRVMVGESLATPDLTEMEIANHFQYNFGFDKVTHRHIYTCIQALAKKNQRSPMLDYIRSQHWDGKARLGTWINRLWGVDESAFVSEIATKWLVSACARMDQPGCKVDWIFIVVGPQGTGKTTMPGILFKGNYLPMYGDHSDKDLHMLLHSHLVVGFDELDSFGKKEASTLKAIITRQEDAFRPPYGVSVELFPRRFSLYGCGNRYEFLQHDPSGYRRYAVVEVDRILDFRGLESERDQLWAEAWEIYSQGSLQWWAVEGASDNAGRYVVPNVIEEKILNWLQAQMLAKHSTMVKEGELWFTMSQLMAGIGEESSSKNSNITREIAAILRGIGAVQKLKKINNVSARIYSLPMK
jgi:hypothetical protein